MSPAIIQPKVRPVPFIERLSRRLRYGEPIIVVSGLPRSGTSMVMKMLQAGGVPLLTDGIRTPDESNPLGYFEFEPAKQLDKPGDPRWLANARGKAVKIISFQLTWLPTTYDYRVIFMQRDLDEVITSQNTMLVRRGQDVDVGTAENREMYARHLQQVSRFMSSRTCFKSLTVDHGDVIRDPAAPADRIRRFLGRRLDIARMAAAVDPRFHRSRR